MPTAPSFAAPKLTGPHSGPLPCTTDPDLFHPYEGTGSRGRPAEERIRRAVALCCSCPVMLACREWAREQGEYGVWGAETDAERTEAGYRSRVPGTDPRPLCGTTAGAQWERRHGTGRPCADCTAAEEGAKFLGRRRPVAATTAVRAPELTPGECDVLLALASGLDRKGISAALGRSRQSVTKAISCLRKKLGVDNEGILHAAWEAGLLPHQFAPAA
ncbi:WhiB family transcriptional regulator [Streptomyces sp. NPDC054841]